jgi:hypothetical protein
MSLTVGEQAPTRANVNGGRTWLNKVASQLRHQVALSDEMLPVLSYRNLEGSCTEVPLDILRASILMQSF